MTDPSIAVKDVGEQGVLQLVQRFCPVGIVGDDAALIELASDRALVVTTDVLVDGVHFSDRTTSAEDVGWRAAAANLSDLAAMGASPVGITVGLSVSGDLPLSWVENLYQGLYRCLQQYQTPIIGGDVCRSPTVTLSITALGQVLPHRAIRRSAAQPGDAIAVTGVHGASRGGLELLLHPERGQNLKPREIQAFILAHQRPKPRLDVLPILEEIFATQANVTVAGMDSSDGLADAVVQLCRVGGVGAEIDRNSIPIPPGLSQLSSPQQALEWALYGGEDFELVLCLPEELAAIFVERLGGQAAIIGRVTPGSEVLLSDRHSRDLPQKLSLEQGFQHF